MYSFFLLSSDAFWDEVTFLIYMDLPFILNLNPLKNDKILDWSTLKSNADEIMVTQKMKFCMWKGKRYYGKGRNCFWPAYLLSPHCFLKKLFPWVTKTKNTLV